MEPGHGRDGWGSLTGTSVILGSATGSPRNKHALYSSQVLQVSQLPRPNNGQASAAANSRNITRRGRSEVLGGDPCSMRT